MPVRRIGDRVSLFLPFVQEAMTFLAVSYAAPWWMEAPENRCVPSGPKSSAERNPMLSARTSHASDRIARVQFSPRRAKEALRSDQSCTACTRREDRPVSYGTESLAR